MRVVIVSDARNWGGLEMHTMGLIETLAPQGYRFTLACVGDRAFDLYRARLTDAVDIVDLGQPARRNALRWYSAFLRVKGDVVILQKGTLHTGGFALDVALRVRFRRYVAIQHLEPPPLPQRTSRRYFNGTIPGVGLWWYRWRFSGYLRSLMPDVTVCVSDSVRRALASDYGFALERLVTIRNGVSLQQFHPSGDTRRAIRKEWKIPSTAFVFGCVRRFIPEKGLDVLIRAFAKLKLASDRDIYLVLIGEGPERDSLEKLSSDLGVSQHVKYPGFAESPWTVYPGFDVFVIPSRIEALGVVVVEAMASGCFVIASRVGGIPEMLSGPSLGTLVPAGDPDALMIAMRQTLNMGHDEMSEHVAYARQHVGDHFNLQTQCMRIAELLKR